MFVPGAVISGFIRLLPSTDHRAAAAKGSNVIRAGVQRTNGVGCRVDGRRIFHGGTVRTRAIRPDHHHDAGGGLSFDSSLQRVRPNNLPKAGSTHALIVISGALKRVALTAAYRVRRKKPFHALEVSGRCAVTLVHVTATDPLRSGRHADLVAHAVIANCGAYRMRAMTNVVARKRRIVAAWIADAVVDGIMPVVIVIGRDSVPAAVVRLQRVMRPALAGISAANRNSLTPEAQRPHIRCVRVSDARLNRLRFCGCEEASTSAFGCGKDISNVWIAFHSRHILTGRQRFGDLAAALHQNRVHNVEGTMLDRRAHATIAESVLVLPGSYSAAPRTRSDPFQLLWAEPMPHSGRLGQRARRKIPLAGHCAVCSITHGAIFSLNVGPGVSFARWVIARDDLIAPATAIPAAMKKNKQRTTRNRNNADSAV